MADYRTLVLALIDRAVAAVGEHADELSRLDAAIGDGDHGANLRRGFLAIAADRDALAELPLGEALQKAGMSLVLKVGGAAGPLYGTALTALGKELAGGTRLEEAASAALEAVRRRGKSEVGAKTMVDVLAPAVRALKESAGRPRDERVATLRAAVDGGREATIPMVATRGRASFLGERSRGHADPGATSAALLIHAACDAVEGRP